MPLGRTGIESLIPQKGAMCLLDGVRDWTDSRIVCVTGSHRGPGNPLARGGVLHAVCGLEYAAQAMALHGRLTAGIGSRPQIGYIASVRKLIWRVPRLDAIADDLQIEAERRADDGKGVLYSFCIKAGRKIMLSGQTVVMFADGAP